MAKTRSSGRESGHDRNRMFVEGVMLEDLGPGTHTSPATATMQLIQHTDRSIGGFGGYTIPVVYGGEITVVNRSPLFDKLGGREDYNAAGVYWFTAPAGLTSVGATVHGGGSSASQHSGANLAIAGNNVGTSTAVAVALSLLLAPSEISGILPHPGNYHLLAYVGGPGQKSFAMNANGVSVVGNGGGIGGDGFIRLEWGFAVAVLLNREYRVIR